jgi:serine/threonine protein kinase
MPAAALVCAVCQEQALGQEQPINGYLVIRELGRGGMGVVRLAVRHADGRAVALKTIMPAHWGSRSQVERFLREARILQELDHPNIVAFRDMGKAGDLLYFAMDFIQGQDASKILKREGPIAVRRAVAWTCELLQALDYAHAKGFVHRDIKPGNLLMDAAHPPLTTGGRRQERVRLADFGLARVYQNSPLSGLTLQGDVAGTYAFMAPEQITSFRESKPSVDLYAVAATLYNLLTAKTIFDMPKEAALRIMMILHDDPVPIRNRRSDVPKKLADIIHRTLRKDPEDRYADAKTLRRALLEFAE